jgi:hypothetical protein
MHQHLVVDELIPLGEHDHAVEQEHAPEDRTLHNADVLNAAVLAMQQGIQAGGQPGSVAEKFGEAQFSTHLYRPRRYARLQGSAATAQPRAFPPQEAYGRPARGRDRA